MLLRIGHVTKRFRAIVSYFTIRCGGAVTDQIVWRILPEREPREFGAFTRRRAWLPSLGSLWGSSHNGYKMVMLVALVVCLLFFLLLVGRMSIGCP